GRGRRGWPKRPRRTEEQLGQLAREPALPPGTAIHPRIRHARMDEVRLAPPPGDSLALEAADEARGDRGRPPRSRGGLIGRRARGITEPRAREAWSEL